MTILARALSASVVGTTFILLETTAGAQEPARRRAEPSPSAAVETSAQTTQDDGVAVRALGALTNRSFAGLTFEYRADGTVGLDLQGRFQNVMLATTRPDGTLDVSCVADGHEQALKELPQWTVGRGASARRLDAISHLPAPIVVAAPLEEK